MGATQQGADATKGRWLTIPRTLCFVRNGNDILLMKRAAHKRVFPNQYNGLGGHIERNEDPLTGARREIKEESGLDVYDIKLRAIHNIDAGADTGIILMVYTAQSDNRNFVDEGLEGTLEWIPINAINEYDLVEDLPLILPKILGLSETSPPYSVHVSYDENDDIQMQFVTE
ncbi:MAG: NUDIX domain-containing protein [Phototrophicaceae bacterium]